MDNQINDANINIDYISIENMESEGQRSYKDKQIQRENEMIMN